MKIELPSLGSRDVDAFLLEFHDVPANEQDGYIQRLRNITRLGFPAGLSIGKGHPSRYHADQFFQLLAVTELYRCRVPPTQAVKLVDASWADMKLSILAVWESRDAAEHGKSIEAPRKFWRVPAEGGQRMTRTEGADEIRASEKIEVLGRDEVDLVVDKSDLLTHCYIFIDVLKLIEGILNHMKWGGSPMAADKIALFMSGMGHAR